MVRYFIFPKEEIASEIKLKSKNQMKALKKDEKAQYTRMEEIEIVSSFLAKLEATKPLAEVKPVELNSELGELSELTEPVDDEPVLDLIKTFYPCASFTHNKIDYTVVKGCVPKEALESFSKFSGKQALSKDSLTSLGLEDVIVAETDQELFDYVLDKFGIDLSGEREVGLDEEGNPMMAPWLIPVSIL